MSSICTDNKDIFNIYKKEAKKCCQIIQDMNIDLDIKCQYQLTNKYLLY